MTAYRAFEITASGPAYVDRELPPAGVRGDDVMVVEPVVAGICRSDIKEAAGIRSVRSDFGHELVARVARPGALARRAGRLVTFDPHVPIVRSSGFAELMTATGPSGALRRAFPLLPSAAPPERFVFTEPLSCACHCVRSAQRAFRTPGFAGVRAAVIGCGNAGTLIGLVLRHLGASTTMLNRTTQRLAFLRDRELFSGAELGHTGEGTAGAFDLVVAATSFLEPSVLARARELVSPGGTVVLYGGTAPSDDLDESRIPFDAIRRGERVVPATWGGKPVTIAGTYGATGADFRAARKLLLEAPRSFPVERMIAREIAFEQLAAAFDDGRTDSPGKVVVRFTERAHHDG